MVPETWSATDRTFCHFGLFFAFHPANNPKNQNFEKMKKLPRDIIILYMYTTNENHMMYGSCDMECNGQNFLSFCTVVFLFNPLTTNPKNQNFEKMKKKLGVIIFLHMCTIYDVWFLRYRAQQTEFFVILDHFLHLHPPNNPKSQNFEKMKKTPGDIIILHKCTINYNDIMYGS